MTVEVKRIAQGHKAGSQGWNQIPVGSAPRNAQIYNLKKHAWKISSVQVMGHDTRDEAPSSEGSGSH